MISRVLGLVRDILLARFIGAGGEADAFYIAFKVPNFLRRLFAEGAFAQAFVPVLSELRQSGPHAAVKHFVDRIAGCLGLSLLLITVLVVIAAPLVAAIFGFGFIVNDQWQKFWLTSELLRITFPYLFLISMTGFAGGILNSYDRFAVPALTPVFLNLSLITAAAFVSPHLAQPVYALAWAVFVAGVLQLALQLPYLARLSLLPRPKLDWKDKQVKKVLKLMAPAIFGVSVSQINLTLDTILASFLVDGSIGWLFFSDRLIELPLGVFAVGIATVILPNLSRQFSADDGRFGATLAWAMQMVLLIAIPAALALILLAKPLLYTLFQYGEMSAHDMDMAALSLRAYAVGLCAFMLIKVLASAYFSRQDMKTPVRIGVIAMIANMFLNLIFVLPLLWLWNIGHVGLAAATSCSAALNAFLLYRGLSKLSVFDGQGHWPIYLLRLVFAALVMSAVVYWLMAQQQDYAALDWFDRCLQLGVLVGGGLVSYGFALLLAGMRPRHLKPTHA